MIDDCNHRVGMRRAAAAIILLSVAIIGGWSLWGEPKDLAVKAAEQGIELFLIRFTGWSAVRCKYEMVKEINFVSASLHRLEVITDLSSLSLKKEMVR